MKRREFIHGIGASALGVGLLPLAGCVTPLQGAQKRPNIVLIMVDDMGFADIGCFGGTLKTPNLDQLAFNGMRFTNFYTQPVCAPTRAATISGLSAHSAGAGANIAKWNDPFWTRIDSRAYESFHADDTITIAELLKDAGYQTFMTGKWHLGDEPERWPVKRGFDRSYALIWGASDHFEPGWAPYALDEQLIAEFPDDFYTTDYFTKFAKRFVEEADRDKPFFLYLSYSAPHTPHQVPEENKKRVDGMFDPDWDKDREARLKRQIEMGLFPEGTELGERDPAGEKDPCKDQQVLVDRYEVYQAMIDRIDQKVGELVESLKRIGEFDNTLLVFLSDNGATPPWYQLRWAENSNCPFRLIKGQVHEGGIKSPMFVHWPGQVPPGTINRQQVGHVMDFLPTFAAVAGAAYPDTYRGRKLQPVEGRNLLPAFMNPAYGFERTICWEHGGNEAIRRGDWKLVRVYRPLIDAKEDPTTRTGVWELYDLSKDPVENHDLSAQYPERAEAMKKTYREWADRVGVVPWEHIQTELKEFRAEKDADS